MNATFNAGMLLKRRALGKLPKKAFVTLSEALSWLAFNIPLNSEILELALRSDDPDSIEGARSRLMKSINQLTDVASGGRIEMRGKFVRYPDFDTDSVKTEPIPPNAFHDFARFDVHHDGLNPGRGLAWRYSSEGLLDMATIDRPKEAYRSVMVNRDAFLLHMGKMKRVPSRKTELIFPSTEAILAQADKMKASGMNGRAIAANISSITGFEGAYEMAVRALLLGRYPRGRGKWVPPK